MNVSRFVGSTNREAMRQVRLALGPDAMSLACRCINGGVEIMAADPTWAPAAIVQGQAAAESPVRRVAGLLTGLKADADAPFVVLKLLAIKEMLQG